jgi:hypothetical protein
MALPVAMAGAIGGTSPDTTARRTPRSNAAWTAAARMVPGLTPQIPGKQAWFASFVPNLARDAAAATRSGRGPFPDRVLRRGSEANPDPP